MFELHDKIFAYHREYSDFDERHIELVKDIIVLTGTYDECYKKFWKIYKKSHSLMIQEAGTNNVVFPT